MATAQEAEITSDRLFDLAGRLIEEQGFAEVVDCLKQGHAATIDGTWGSSCALAAAALAAHAPDLLVVVCPNEEQVEQFIDDLALFTRWEAEDFPAAELSESRFDDEAFGQRLRVLKKLLFAGEPQFASPSRAETAAPRLLVASIQSLLQPNPDRATLLGRTRILRRGQSAAIEEWTRRLAEGGLAAATAVELPGEFAVRGGILDIFAPDWQQPVRVEFVGDGIESLRRFDVATQRSLATLDEVEVTLIGQGQSGQGYLTDFLPLRSWFLLIEPSDLEQQARLYLERVQPWSESKAGGRRLHTFSDLMRQVYRFPSVTASAIAAASWETTCRLRIESVERFSGEIQRVRKELDEAAGEGEVFIVCQTEAEARRLREIFSETAVARQHRLHFALGKLHSGFRLLSAGVTLLSSGEMFRRIERPRPVGRRLGRPIDSFLELQEGELVVHVSHGIARYRGMKLLEKQGQIEEHLELEFQGGTRLYVPASKIGLVQKYVGGTKSRPKPAKLHGRLWGQQCRRAAQAVADLAAEMLEMQAIRLSRPGIAFPPDTEWQREFDAAFAYVETPDQFATIEAIKRDMSLPRPMDRLLCGDVGYGKTEVAMRAAFKAVDAGYQVAVLVPTTLLCEQHYRTFSARMAEFPFEIAALSRFASRGEQKKIIERLAEGAIDIVIGTHRLVQPDVRFHNLGLVIIDEEQRFGVEIKERLKALRRTVDVLTMTATPIPRTLHMALLGLRDISNLETPPEDRLAVETRVARFDPELIRQAVLRELNRGGQIFFVHNRIEDISAPAQRLRQIVPEARLAVAHGRMPEHELEQVMIDFFNRRHDMLLATTIVESGLDVPNANTMFIDEADRYGLADLHQLRGRVGRYKHRAYCYLLIDPNKSLSPAAAKRLRAIEEYSRLGAGFAIAMRDLEIRGAGNILGTEQSGHIAAVGYQLYCELLEQAVRRLQRLPPVTPIEVDIDLPGEGYIPRSYILDLRQKIDIYRRLARTSTLAEVGELRAELHDRFGFPPPPVVHLLELAEMRIAAHRWGVKSIHKEDSYLVFGYTSRERIQRLAAAGKGRLRVVDQRSAYLPLDKEINSPEVILSVVKSLLQAT